MRRGIAALGVFAAATALAACNGNTTPTTNSSENSNETLATLTIWADDTRFSQVQSFAEDFTASTGVAVNVVQKSEADMDTEFTTQVPTGNGPDLIVMAHDKLGALVSNGVVAPVDLGQAKEQFSDVAVKAVTYNGQTYGVPYAVESVALVRNNALTQDTPTTYDDMIASGKKTGVEYPFIIQMGDKGDPYHFYGFQTSFGAPVFNTNADGEYTSELAMGGSGGTDFANWLKAQGDAGIISPSITGDIAKQAFLDGKAAYTVTGPWNVAAFRDNKMDVSVLPIPAAGSQAAQPFVGVQMFYQSAKSANPVAAKQFFNYDRRLQGRRVPRLQRRNRHRGLPRGRDWRGRDLRLVRHSKRHRLLLLQRGEHRAALAAHRADPGRGVRRPDGHRRHHPGRPRFEAGPRRGAAIGVSGDGLGPSGTRP